MVGDWRRERVEEWRNGGEGRGDGRAVDRWKGWVGERVAVPWVGEAARNGVDEAMDLIKEWVCMAVRGGGGWEKGRRSSQWSWWVGQCERDVEVVLERWCSGGVRKERIFSMGEAMKNCRWCSR